MYTNIALFFSSILFLVGSLKAVLMHNDYNTGIEYQLVAFALIIILRVRLYKEQKDGETADIYSKHSKKKVTVDELYGRKEKE